MDSTEELKQERHDSVEDFLNQGGESWEEYKEWVADKDYEMTATSESAFKQLKEIIRL